MAKVRIRKPRRGEIWLIDFSFAVGAEIRKLRPALIASEDHIGRLPLRIVVPITDLKPAHQTLSWIVPIPASSKNGLHKDSCADAFQCKSVSIDRFDRRIGEVTAAELMQVAAAIAMCVGAP